MKALMMALGLSLLAATAQARTHTMARVSCDLWGCRLVSDSAARPVAKPATWKGGWTHYKGRQRVRRRAYVRHVPARNNAQATRSVARFEPHPAGCPHVAFCGCGTAVKVFGAPIRSLWLAWNWMRFPPAEPGPGMVAVRRHHVFAILEYRAGLALAYDPNSGGHKTRIHWVSLNGYSVRNPRGRT